MSFVKAISEYIQSGESKSRKLGLEIEHFVVDKAGNQIGFDEISPLIQKIGTELGAEIHYMDGYPVGYYTGEYSTSLEPSCQFEISIDPYSDLDRIKEVYLKFRKLWDPVFARLGYHFETKGNLPLVETGKITPSDIPLSPKKRYKYMNAYFENSGKYGKYMMRASASTQISVDYRSEEDMVQKLQVLEKISPLLMIMMENKSREDSTLPGNYKRHLLRIQEWDDLDPARTGFVPHSFDKDFGYRKMAEVIYNTPLILLTDEGKTIDVGSKSAKALVKEGVISEKGITAEREKKLIEHVMSMGFFHYRVKKYIEIRVADSVPIEKALGYAALIKGLLYSEKALAEVSALFENVTTIKQIQEAVEEIEKYGACAYIYEGKRAKELADELIAIAKKHLGKKDREYLENVRIIWCIDKKGNRSERTAKKIFPSQQRAARRVGARPVG